MKKAFTRLLMFLAVSVIFATSAYAEHLFGPDQLDTTYGAIIRARQEIWDDVVTLDTNPLLPTGGGRDRNFFRLKTSLFGLLDYDKKVSLFTKITNEAKYFTGPYKPNLPRNTDKLDEDELVFDNLYVNAKNVGGLPVDIRIGRQDLINVFGEGFLIQDGTPADGSRTFYFNAAKANVRLSPNVNFDLMYISDTKTDIYLPSLHTDNTKKLLTGSNEQGFVAYGRGKIGNLSLEPYYMYKTEQPVNTAGSVPSKLKLNTIGGKIGYTINSWNMGGEFAHQFGEYNNGKDRTGNGGYVYVGRKYETVTLKPEFDLRYVYLSGDKAGTDKIETWDPLFSRNPYWNELFIYTLIVETSKYGGAIPGYWTNLELLKASVKLNFTPATNLALSYQYLWAPQKTQGLPAFMFSNSSTDRGHLPTAMLSHKFNKNIDGYLQLEYFVPGDFYSNNADNALFFRWQVQVKI